jgi:hypothetical protein
MRFANLMGRSTLVDGSGAGLDVEKASDGRFPAEPRSLFAQWDEFRQWAAAQDGGQISPSTPQTCARVDGARDPKRFLEPGGRLVSHVAGIGELHNRLVAGSSYRPPA